jgi:hypothetical protein
MRCAEPADEGAFGQRYYDLATPFHGADYEFSQPLALEPQLQANIRYTYYEAGT